MVNRYDKPAQAQFINAYAPIDFDALYRIGAANKAAVDQAEKELEANIKTFGSFKSLSEKDTQNYYNESIGKLKDLIQTAAENPDAMKSASFRSQLQSRINNIDYANYTYKQEFNEMCSLHRECRAIKEGIVAYDETVWGENNIFEQIKKIFERCGSQTAIVTARGDIEKDKRQYSFWPRINQYNYPIQDEDANPPKSKEQTAHESYYDLMPGDLESGRYKVPYERLDDRYSVSKGCD